ncbi:hypothetical protein B0T16DRAFT_456020 [Cercophora newfieldiana]|uniref:Uncharacterized protein n=1 Tax=Cercophora newfieldiana TaxID=92897 RepID=A0AA39YBP3_9PEZI|nr:hypothetical protein B0T16DRAFT_456020 [Cercophora newfieldiana]
MRFTSILSLATAFSVASAMPTAEAPADDKLLMARDRGGRPNGAYWSVRTPNLPIIGHPTTCVWWYCSGGTAIPWIDCGYRACLIIDGVPNCSQVTPFSEAS